MERISQKDDVLLDYSAQRSFMNSPSDMDMDFNDVFGGPPRRFSNQEVRSRHSFNDSMESEEDSASSSRSPWTGLVEKPVFGAENSNRRRNACDDFYDDIFKADDSYSSPRRSDYKDPFGSNPGSRVLSPVRPLSPKVELLGTSLPAQFSLPAKLTKATDHPLFASGSHSQKKREKEMKNDVPTFYRQSPLSREVTVKSDDIDMSGSDEKDIGGNMMKNGESMETSSDDYQFHFSIYKWADKGVPILMSLRGGLHFKSKEKIKIERCTSSNGRIENDNTNADSSRTASENQSYGSVRENLSIPKSEFLQSVEDTAAVDGTSLRTEGVGEKQKTGLFEGSQVEVPSNLEETRKDELKPLRALLVNEDEEKGNIKMAQETEGKSNTVKATKTAQSNVKGDENVKKGDAEVSNSMQKSESEAKRSGKRGLDRKTKVDKGVKKGSPLGSPLRSTENSTKAGIKGKVQDFVKMFNHEVHSTPREGESRSKSFRWKPSSNNEVESEKGSNTAKENEKVQSPSINKMQDATKPKANEKVQSPTINKMQDATKPKANESVQLPTVNKMQDATENVDKNLNKQEKTTKYSKMKTPNPQTKDDQNLNKQEKTTRYPQMKTPTPQTKDYSDQKTAPSVNESKRDERKASVGSMEDLFGGNFVVEELYEDQGNASQTNDSSVDIQASDAKVRQWSQGRKGNIRSLLSTLQLVLWPDSGWKPVALVDLIEASSVKRSYQRALLYLHPDKLQQKGAAPHQKFIAEKVFDILQEAWDHFNSLGL